LASTKLAPAPFAPSKKGTTGKKGTRVQENRREENTAEGSKKEKEDDPQKGRWRKLLVTLNLCWRNSAPKILLNE
jgi:hypothetical protein